MVIDVYYFSGCTLSKDNKAHTFDPSELSEEDVEHKLQVSHACLGEKAKPGERNLIEAVTEDDNGKQITVFLLSLKMGLVESSHCDFGFRNKTVLRLKSGSGPISLTGQHLQAYPLDFDEDQDSEESEGIS